MYETVSLADIYILLLLWVQNFIFQVPIAASAPV